MIDLDLIKKAYKEFSSIKPSYIKMERYYEGQTDAMANYQMVTERSNNKTHTNYIKNFIEEEVSYSVGNDVSYVSRSGDSEITMEIDYQLAGLSESHDINLLEKMLITSVSYELYYIDKKYGNFACKVIPASGGYPIYNDDGSMRYFIREFSNDFEDKVYLDIYDEQNVYHYDSKFKEVSVKSSHNFGDVPVGVATYNIEEDNRHKTIYSAIKGLQDSYETMLSDSTNEISDFRNAYLTFTGVQLDEETLVKMKELGIMQIEDPTGKVEWLIKNINDSFVQNTLTKVEENMYKLTNHINHNDKVISATSSLAIKARMLSLQQKCKLNQKALEDCIKSRLRALFSYIVKTSNKKYDFRDIRIVFSANLPSDDVLTANMISQLGDKISLETALSQLSFIENPRNEIERIKFERAEFAKATGSSEVDVVTEVAKLTK